MLADRYVPLITTRLISKFHRPLEIKVVSFRFHLSVFTDEQLDESSKKILIIHWIVTLCRSLGGMELK